MHLTVLMPVFNCRRYLAAAIESIRAQTFTDYEFIIVDDGSTDGSAAIIDRAAADDARIRVIRRPNTGIVGALNDGLAASRGEFVARMDGDDISEPTRFINQLAWLRSHPGCVALGAALHVIDARDAVVDLYEPPLHDPAIESELLRGNGGALSHPAVIFRRDALRAVGGYDPAFCKAEDLDLYFRIRAHGRLANLPEPLLRYRLHPQSTNFRARFRQKALMQKIVDRERALRELPRLDLATVTGTSDLPPAELHRQWACTSCRHGRRSTARRHALRALWLAPFDRRSWSVLRYATTQT